MLNLVPLELGGGAFVAERFLTFPLALFALAVGSQVGLRPGWARLALGLWGVAALATVQLTLPHWKNDETLWRWAVTRAPQSALPFTNLALAEIKSGRPAAGLALVNQALARDPNDANAHNNAGLALIKLGRYEDAERAIHQAIALRPDNALYHNNLAGALRDQGRLQEAERVLLDEALARDPRLWVAHFNLGIVYLRADRPDLAALALAEAQRWAPAEEQADIAGFVAQAREPVRWLRLSDVLMANGQAEAALRAVEEAAALGAGQVDVAIGRSAALTLLGRLDEAEAVARAALAANENDARLHNVLGQVALARGDKAEARRRFERAIELAPEWPLPKQNLELLR